MFYIFSYSLCPFPYFLYILGDFSILVRSGMSMCKAALLNLLSGCTSIIGVFIGVALGSNEEIRKWLVAATGGMFIYISLVAMVGVCLSVRLSVRNGRCWVITSLSVRMGGWTFVCLSARESGKLVAINQMIWRSADLWQSSSNLVPAMYKRCITNCQIVEHLIYSSRHHSYLRVNLSLYVGR